MQKPILGLNTSANLHYLYYPTHQVSVWAKDLFLYDWYKAQTHGLPWANVWQAIYQNMNLHLWNYQQQRAHGMTKDVISFMEKKVKIRGASYWGAGAQ